MKTAAVLAGLAAALVLQTGILAITMAGGTVVNLVLVAVVYVALGNGAVPGLLAGAAGGLAQDAMSGGIVGIGGFSKTVVGFVVGVLGAQFIVSQPLPRFVMFVGATVAHELCYQALSALVESRAFAVHYSTMLTQAFVNAVVGIVAFWVVERSPSVLQRRRIQSGTIRRRY
jgi:rod shape-determining protein MreD